MSVAARGGVAVATRAVGRSVPWWAWPVRVIRSAWLAFPRPAENPAGLVDAAVLAVVGSALRLGVLGETIIRGQLQARAGQVVGAGRAASGAWSGRLTRPERACLGRIRLWPGPGDQVRGRPGHGGGLFPGYSRMPG
jgi:hypothetical protein